MEIARVNGALVKEYCGQTVRIVGRMTRECAGDMNMVTTDGLELCVRGKDVEKAFDWKFVEVCGKIDDDLGITADYLVPMESELDLDAWNDMVAIMKDFKDTVF
jgi:hypothetical protein